jgi:hypothetical protein
VGICFTIQLLVAGGGDVELLGANTNTVHKKTGAFLDAEDVGKEINAQISKSFYMQE